MVLHFRITQSELLWQAPTGNRSSAQLSTPKYRPDIDGLRAVAVLAVVGFHASPSLFAGGFVGVDVFFVISGFLISAIIIENLAAHKFSFGAFYVRRIRRIFPALVLLLVCVAALGRFLLLPDELWQLAKHAAAGAAFIANYAYLSESGYFDADAVAKPLLHLWSLGIEEQFYIVWPLLLWLVWRRINVFALVLAVGVVSFALNVIEYRIDPYVAFYSIHTRAWELAVGASLAALPFAGETIIARCQALRRRVGENCMSVCGAVLILGSVLLFSQAALFRGYAMVLPTFGALLLIAAGEKAWFNRRVLSLPALVWVGLISYPLYLWHWPLISFAWIVEGHEPSRALRITAVAASVLLAWLTYRFVERPIRYCMRGDGMSAGLPAAGLSTGGLSAAGLSAAMALVGVLSAGVYIAKPGWLPNPHNRAIVETGDPGAAPFLKYYAEHFSPCAKDRNSIMKDCVESQPDKPIKIAILGDSHAQHLLAGLAAAFPGANVAYFGNGLRDWTNNLPSMGNADYRDIFRYVLDSPDIRTVIISAFWKQQLAEHQVPAGSSLENELKTTALALTAAGKKVYLADDTPQYPFMPQQCKYARELAPKPQCAEDRNVFDQIYQQSYPALQSVAGSVNGVNVLNLANFFCDAATCRVVKDETLLYRDTNHLNIAGSLIVGRLIAGEYPNLAD
jgi:peptidoglycan/LPS O-acetylase OafA/YrhL